MGIFPTPHYTCPKKVSEAGTRKVACEAGVKIPMRGEKQQQGRGYKPPYTEKLLGPVTLQTVTKANEDDLQFFLTSVMRKPPERRS